MAVTFRGMTARPDENNCECHWGSEEDLAQLKVPDVELNPGPSASHLAGHGLG